VKIQADLAPPPASHGGGPSNAPRGSSRPTAVAEGDQRPDAPRVLVVEDEPSIRAIVTDLLRFEGYEVRDAGNGLEALSMLDAWRPDAIVLDLMMPVMNGWAFAEAAHQVLGPHDVPPILVASASPDLADAAASLRKFGVRAAVAKPFDVDVLLAALQRLIVRTTADAWPAAS
jgi:two-component system, OmpR family, response regulator MprA